MHFTWLGKFTWVEVAVVALLHYATRDVYRFYRGSFRASLLQWAGNSSIAQGGLLLSLVVVQLLCMQPFWSTAAGQAITTDSPPLLRPIAEPILPESYRMSSSATDNLGGYASKVSVIPGERIDFHISTDWPRPYDLVIWRQGQSRIFMTSLAGVAPGQYDCTNGYATGCNWPVARQFVIPDDWPSGVYTVEIPTAFSGTQYIIFTVRAPVGGISAKILYLSSVNTWQAYNPYGGKSLYEYNSTNGVRAAKVSYNRPYINGVGEFPRWEEKFVRWMEQEGYPFDYATTYDLETVPTLLSGYDVVLTVGHSEYWTWGARQRLKQFIADGGRYINLSGNTMWWQVRLEDNGRTLVGYKYYDSDPHKEPELITTNPWDYPTFDSPYSLIGAHWPQGGYPFSTNLSYANGYGGFQAQQADHWVFANTGLTNNRMFGRNSTTATTILDHEVDGATFNCDVDGYTVLSSLANMGSPKNFTILGVAPAYLYYLGFSVMGIATNENGGAIFSVNTTGWANGLGIDPAVSQITRNVLDRFLDRENALPTEPTGVDNNFLFRDRFNCRSLPNQWPTPDAPEWRGLPAFNYVDATSRTAFQFDQRCGVSGSGLKMPVDAGNNQRLSVMVKPNWGTAATLYSSIYVDLANLTLGEGDTIDLLRMLNDSRINVASAVSALQLRRTGAAYFMGYASSTGDEAWVPVPKDQPFLVKTTWDRARAQMAIWVNGYGVEQPMANAGSELNNNLLINRVDLGLFNLTRSASGYLCADEFIVNDQPIHEPLLDLLSLDVRIVGQGVVTQDPPKALYGDGELVTLRALAEPGWEFVQWEGFPTVNSPTTTLTVEEHTVVTATFEQRVSVVTTVEGKGEVLREPPTETLRPGETITLTALPANGWRFVAWRGAIAATTPTVTYVVDANQLEPIIAVFEEMYPLSVTIVGDGTVIRNPDKSFYALGETVTLTAQPAAAWQFFAWGGLASGSNRTTEITISPNAHVTATFTEITGSADEYALTIVTVGAGSVRRDPDQRTYPVGQTVQLTAIPDPDWRFVGWDGAASGHSEATLITIAANEVVTATFVEIPSPVPTYTVQVKIEGQGTVSRDPNLATYTAGQEVQLTATPTTGWRFAGWLGDASGSAPTARLTVTKNQVVTATFAKLSPEDPTVQLEVTTEGSGSVSRNPDLPTYAVGQVVQLTAISATGWHFSQWRGTAILTDASASVQSLTMARDEQVVAIFEIDPPPDAMQRIYLPFIAR